MEKSGKDVHFGYVVYDFYRLCRFNYFYGSLLARVLIVSCMGCAYIINNPFFVTF